MQIIAGDYRGLNRKSVDRSGSDWDNLLTGKERRAGQWT